MNLDSFVVAQILRQFQIPEPSIKHLTLAANLSSVNGRGFPKELLLLSAPMISRGLLNYAVLQMKRHWVFPYWVHRQLNPTDNSFIPRSQNPLLMNITHRNWTAIGSPYGRHEAIVDPRGLVTVLPREWSVDTWLSTNNTTLFPSLSPHCEQSFDASAPSVLTKVLGSRTELTTMSFVGATRKHFDVLFQRSTVRNISDEIVKGVLWFALRPFNPEGVSPIEVLQLKGRFIEVNNALGVVLAREPDLAIFGSSGDGDSSGALTNPALTLNGRDSIRCQEGLANVAIGYRFELPPDESVFYDCSVALENEKSLRSFPVKQSWRVSFESRLASHRGQWAKAIAAGSSIRVADQHLQDLLETARTTLLQFHDGPFVSPGAYLYYHFWFRDAALMLRALDVLGFADRSKQVIDVFRERQSANGFFKGPDGEWDSNGAVIWTVWQHHLLSPSTLWLRRLYPTLRKGAVWIMKMRRTAAPGAIPGLMPRSLSAEHLGTVDQYYWDTFWSLAGIQCMKLIARELGKGADTSLFENEESAFVSDIQSSLSDVARKNSGLIPASPSRPFDEGAIGSICAAYPLKLLASDQQVWKTVRALIARFCDDRGYPHPIIHSGYNVYMTLQLAHACLLDGDVKEAWRVADTVFKHAHPPYSFPEAIHPLTGGGSMGDGHHGWAAAEIVLFIRECLVREYGNRLVLFEGAANRLVVRGRAVRLERVPTNFGQFSVALRFESPAKGVLECAARYFPNRHPEFIEIHLPFRVVKATPVSSHHFIKITTHDEKSILIIHPDTTTVFLEI